MGDEGETPCTNCSWSSSRGCCRSCWGLLATTRRKEAYYETSGGETAACPIQKVENLRSSQVAMTNENVQDLLSGQRQVTRPLLGAQSGIVDRANLPSQRSLNCYNLEHEFMASATLPR
jgi:hypothetical protein